MSSTWLLNAQKLHRKYGRWYEMVTTNTSRRYVILVGTAFGRWWRVQGASLSARYERAEGSEGNGGYGAQEAAGDPLVHKRFDEGV